jgi:DNA repair exonuclease SbcCD ATPase subunit
MDDLDPAQAATLEDLAACLRQLHRRADRPSLRTLASRTSTVGGLLPGTSLTRVPLRRTTLSEMLQAQILPRKAFLLTFVEACGVQLETDQRWEQAWNRLADQDQNQAGKAVEQLYGEIEKLRQELAAASQRAEAAEDSAQKASDALRELETELLESRQETHQALARAQRTAEESTLAVKNILVSGIDLAIKNGQTGHAAGARDQLAALLPIAEQALGPDHRTTLVTRSQLADWTGIAGDAAAARDQIPRFPSGTGRRSRS